MARALGWLALIIAYTATLFYIAAMCTPWWYTRYYSVDSSEDAFYDANPGLDQHTGLFSSTNCFIDGSCITGGQIYKNNSSLQWVYTATLVLMIVGWVPWLLFVHLLHFRSSKNPNYSNKRGLRPLMLLTALATWFLIAAAIIVFAVGMNKSNGVYRRDGLYGQRLVSSQNGFTGIDAIENSAANYGYNSWQQAREQNLYLAPHAFGSLPYGNEGYTLLGAGIPLMGGINSTTAYTGTLGYKWAAHVAWYAAMIPLILIPLAALLALGIKPTKQVVTQTRTVERTVTTQPAVVPATMGYQQPAVLPETTVNRAY